MEIINEKDMSHIKSVLFDFDGTLSTLRCGWEVVMRAFMAEVLVECGEALGTVEGVVDAYINESAGIQTIYQMKWLADRVAAHGMNPQDPWAYKAEYVRRLMVSIDEKKLHLQAGTPPDEYLMQGAVPFLKALKANGMHLYVASGTDHPDVVAEAGALGVDRFFDEIAGAPLHEENCSKEAVLRQLIDEHHLAGDEVLVIGDGRVEIALGQNAGAHTIGLASDEVRRSGINPQKRERLLNAGADIIIGDFLELDELRALLRL